MEEERSPDAAMNLRSPQSYSQLVDDLCISMGISCWRQPTVHSVNSLHDETWFSFDWNCKRLPIM